MIPPSPKNTDIQMAIKAAMQYHQSGQFPEAEELYCRILAAVPANVEALHLLGVLRHQRGDHAAAINLIGKATRIDKRNPTAFNHLGAAFRAAGQSGEAEHCYRKALKLAPDFADAHFNLGNALLDLKRLKEAERSYRQALSLRSDFAEAYCNLGSVLNDLERPAEGEEACRRALSLRPRYPKALYNLGNALSALEKAEEAEEAFRDALRLDDSFADAWHNLGNALVSRRAETEAEAAYRRALDLNPDHAALRNSLATLLAESGRCEEAIVHLDRAVELRPDHLYARCSRLYELMQACRWDERIETDIALLRRAITGKGTPADPASPFLFIALPSTTAAEQKICAQQWIRRYHAGAPQQRGQVAPPPKRDCIHVGYLSADFHDHVIAQQMIRVFEQHDRSRFRISAFSCGPDDGSAMRKRLMATFDRFADISDRTTEEAARLIAEDGIDILVDLNGYTKNERLAILARRPAPVQAHFLGYAGTIGAGFVDYLLADSFVIPPEHEKHYTERIIRLPDCLMPSDDRCPRPAPPSRQECGLPDDSFVFCNFNQCYKIAPAVFATWCRLLAAVPDSVLWLRAFNRLAVDNLRREAARRGIAPERIVFDPFVTREEHLARMQCADLFLDTVPYNAHATCANALWMGLPVLTCAGDTFASRVAGSLLTTLGVPELVTESLAAYYDTALALATDRGRLKGIKAKIATQRDASPLFDSARFTRNLEAAFVRMHGDGTRG